MAARQKHTLQRNGGRQGPGPARVAPALASSTPLDFSRFGFPHCNKVLQSITLLFRTGRLSLSSHPRRPPCDIACDHTHGLRTRSHVPHDDCRLLGPPRPDAHRLTLDAQAAYHITTTTRAIPHSHRPTLRYGALRRPCSSSIRTSSDRPTKLSALDTHSTLDKPTAGRGHATLDLLRIVTYSRSVAASCRRQILQRQ